MAIPRFTDLSRYINAALTGKNWNSNFQKVVNWFSSGTADVKFNTVETTNGVTINGDTNIVGDVTANNFIGDGSGLTGLNQWRKNFIINGGCLIKNNFDYALVKDTYGTSVDRFDGMATGTAVSAGILTQTTAANCGSTGYALKFSNVTLTGTGIVYLRHRIYSKNAVNFKNKVLSFSMQTYHNCTSSVPYTIYINKASALDDFSSVVAIANNGGVGVNPLNPTELKYENISVGDCTNGLEILIKVECGEITTKSFEFTELQLEKNTTCTQFEYQLINYDMAINNYSTNGDLIISTGELIIPNVICNNIKARTSSGNVLIKNYEGNTIAAFTNSQTIQGTVEGTFKRIYSNTLSAAASSINVTGLNGNTDIEYTIYLTYLHDSGSSEARLQFNNDTTSNYRNGGGSSAVSYLSLSTGSGNTPNYITLNFDARVTGYERPLSGLQSYWNGTTQQISTNGGVYLNTSNNITSMQFTAVGQQFAIGTRLEIYARR